MKILEKICRNKRIEIARQQEAVPLAELKNILCVQSRKKISFKKSLMDSNTGIIAEFKRKSPSKGWINREADVSQVVQSYQTEGAAAISCLTDEQFFGGNFNDFRKAREVVEKIPLLRKDFILNLYQLFQSKVIGADVVLLIAACLTADEIVRFTAVAHELDMEVLLEIHDESELASICHDADVIGINNRNLNTFVTDIQTSMDLVKLIPDKYLKISESGLSSPKTVNQLRLAGFQGFLMGESFMKMSDPGEALRSFVKKTYTYLD
jgi:indole-3-glycerol phosphate synthase